MKRLMMAVFITCLGSQAQADAMSEARAVGQGSISTINTGMRQSNADWTAPAVTALPGGTVPQSSAAGAASGAAEMANQCASNPGYSVECEAINAASANMRTAEDYQSALSGYTDVQRLQSGQMPFGTALEGQSVGGTYSDCTTSTVTKGQKYYDEQTCHNYYLRVLDQPCTKTLGVNILCESRELPRIQAATSWMWSAGGAYNRDGQWSTYKEKVTALLSALGNQTQYLGSFTQGDYWGVVGTNGLPVAFKVNGRSYGTGTSFWYYHIASGACGDGAIHCGTDYGICVNSSPTFQKTGCTGAINDSMVDLNGQGDCPNPVWRPPTEDYAGHYYCPGATDISCPSGSTPQVIDGNTACIGTLSCYEEDTWQNSCLDFEARVPPGQLPPDGVNPDGETIPYPIATAPGSTNFKCERSSSVCTQPEETRVISGVEVTRSCWQYENTFSCLNEDPKSDCDQPRSGECTETGTTCIDQDGDFCTAEEKTFKCMVEDTTHEETVTDCGSQVFQSTSGTAWDTAYAADNDLAAVVAYMEAGREAGGYLDPDSLEIFKGYTSRCRKKLFGLINCCNKGGSSSGSMFSNSAIAAASAGGQALVSTYTYDALFASQAPDMVINGFAAVFGSGSSSALAGMLAGDVTVEGFLSSLIPGPWSIALMALQFSGLLDCSDKDKETALRRDAKLCVDLGRYCSKKLPVIGTCLERTYSFCCFNSVLAKLINTQGKAQLGKTMGSAKHPDCGGFTPEELQTLDLSGMDLTEFMDQIRPPASLVPSTPCYFSGDTSCTAAH